MLLRPHAAFYLNLGFEKPEYGIRGAITGVVKSDNGPKWPVFPQFD
jgi:hypothetical protein